MDNQVYKNNGFPNRAEYLKDLSMEYGVDYGDVLMLAEVLGENEDFDGLVNALEDADMY